jgi:hypothetical protein
MWDFVVDKVALGQVFSEYFSFPCQSSFHQLLQTTTAAGPHILLGTLFSNTFGLCFSLNVRDQVSYPYKTAGKVQPCIF